MPDHDSDSLLNRQTKRRRVDIGVKRTVGTNDTESKSNVLRKLLKRANSYEDTMMPFPGTTIISQLLKNNMAKNGGGPERGERGDRGDRGDIGFPGSGLSNASSDAPQEDACSNSSHDSTPQECLSPFGRSGLAAFDIERLNDEHLRAKRARVENIIRGMSHSPSVVVPAASRHDSRENKRKQRLPQQQQQSFTQLVCQRKEQKQEERRQLKLQLEDMQKQLRQLQEKFFQIYDSTDDSEHNDLHNELNNDIGNMSEDSPGRSDTGGDDRGGDDLRSDNEMSDLDPGHFLDRARALLQEQALLTDREKPRREGLSRSKGQGGPASMHAEGKQLAETLKQELNSAMTQVVDTVVKVFAKPPRPTPQQAFPSLSIPPERFPTTVNGENPNFHTANQRLQCFGDVIIPNPLDSFASMPGMPGPTNDQTEAIPLVVRKTASEHHHHHQSSAVGAHGGHHHPILHPSSLSASMGFSPPSFRHPFPLPLMGYPFQSHLGGPTGGYPGKDRSSPDSMDLSRETTSLRTKMASAHHLGHHHRSCSPAHHGSTAELSLSLIKSECSDLQDMADISPYSGSNIQEGLSPNHLKKAKLMFFYTRYPSSNMLKMFFSDVKFNRCITSQLIKWFSNFREFYYIQMEKFARQSINDGVTGVEELGVSRDSELFRALNMHYNKANDFEVPERFLEVAEITLREFFNAIVAGKDVDPSWKKAIYKVICKLDSEVPEVFKSPNCLQELLHE
uniref:Prospero domain-containing protein n=1 Tax=Gasterosteus aculeatus aculeatus TaxID=481459 RepID=A0AAQ4NYN9_GASAC